MDFQSVFNVIMGLGGLGGFALIIKALAERNKSSAEAEVTIADGALRQMARMEQEIARMDKRIFEQGDKIAAQERRIEALTHHLEEYQRRHGPLEGTDA